MRINARLCTIGLGLLIASTACTHRERRAAKEAVSEEHALHERQKTARGANQALRKFDQDRQAYHKKVEKQLNQLEANIAQLKVEVPSQPDEREAQQESVRSLEQRLSDARLALARLKQAPANEWRSYQQSVEQALLTAQAAYDATSSRLAH